MQNWRTPLSTIIHTALFIKTENVGKNFHDIFSGKETLLFLLLKGVLQRATLRKSYFIFADTMSGRELHGANDMISFNWRFALIFSICSIYVCSFPAKSPSSTWYSISVEMNSTLLTCTNITAKLRTKDCFQHIHNLTPESTFTLDQESARDICHFPLTAPEKKLPLQHGRAALFVHAENTSKNHFVPTKWLKNIFFPTVTAATMNKLRG